MNLKKIPFHPLCFAVYPVIFVISINLVLKEGLRALGFALVFGVMVFGLVQLGVRNWYKSALIASLFLFLFFAYGYIEYFVDKVNVFGLNLGMAHFVMWLYLLILILWIWIVLRQRRIPKTLNQVFSVIGIILVMMPSISIASNFLRVGLVEEQIAPEFPIQVSTNQLQSGSLQEYPDVYYIILDGYAKADILAELYEFDNTSFLDYLSAKGFYVANHSHSNYNQTALSLASSLNMNYLGEIEGSLRKDYKNRAPLKNLIRDNEVINILESLGYQTVSFESGYEWAASSKVDYFLSPERPIGFLRLNQFELSLMNTSMMHLIFESRFLPKDIFQSIFQAPFQDHGDNINYTFSHLADFASADGHYFIFAHIISPHPPFIFDADGNQAPVEGLFVLNDGSGYQGTSEEYIEGYRQQVMFVNKQLIKVIDRIMAESDTPPIIILQADHGPGAYLNWESVETSNLEERMGIFNAYYFPEGDWGLLYESISPVNSFRVLFNSCFGYDFELFPDKMYFAFWNSPYDYVDITGEIPAE